MTGSLLAQIAERDAALSAQAEHLHTQIDQLTTHLTEIEHERHELATARKVVLALGEDQPAPTVPDNPAYQQILTALADADQPLRARDLCHRLDLGLQAKHIEGMRSKLKRLVNHGLVTEDTPGRFAIPRPHTGN